jgi:hypothetical protein
MDLRRARLLVIKYLQSPKIEFTTVRIASNQGVRGSNPFGRTFLSRSVPGTSYLCVRRNDLALVDGFGPGRIGRFMSEPRT